VPGGRLFVSRHVTKVEPAIVRLTVAGLPEGVSIARRFVSDTLGVDHPCSEIAAVLASELVTNSVKHSGSRMPGEVVWSRLSPMAMVSAWK
jgi:hypothetical protein